MRADYYRDAGSTAGKPAVVKKPSYRLLPNLTPGGLLVHAAPRTVTSGRGRPRLLSNDPPDKRHRAGNFLPLGSLGGGARCSQVPRERLRLDRYRDRRGDKRLPGGSFPDWPFAEPR